MSEARVQVLFFSATYASELTEFRGPGRPRPAAHAEHLADPRSWTRDRCAELAMFLLQAARRAGAAAADEMFGLARSPRQRSWREAARRRGLQYDELHACAYGAPQKRPAAFLAAGFALAPIARNCAGYHPHETGGLPRGGSVTAWPPVAQALADVLCSALRRRLRAEVVALRLKLGFERPSVHALADSLPWRVERQRRWRGPSHINLLEQRARSTSS